jgi:hypothetical protein
MTHAPKPTRLIIMLDDGKRVLLAPGDCRLQELCDSLGWLTAAEQLAPMELSVALGRAANLIAMAMPQLPKRDLEHRGCGPGGGSAERDGGWFTGD